VSFHFWNDTEFEEVLSPFLLSFLSGVGEKRAWKELIFAWKYSQEFSRTGFTGGLNWYRNTDRNWELLAAYINARITQPTLFLCGGRDPVFELVGPDMWIEQMRLWVPAIQTKVLPDCGHWIQQERAEEVNAALLTFLQEQTIARGVNAERQE